VDTHISDDEFKCERLHVHKKVINGGEKRRVRRNKRRDK